MSRGQMVVLCEIQPGRQEVVAGPTTVDQAEEAAERLAAADGTWAERTFRWLPGQHDSMVLWAKRLYRDDPVSTGRGVGEAKPTGYSISRDPGRRW